MFTRCKRSLLSTLACTLLLSSLPVFAATYRVNRSGDPAQSHDGLTWGTAFMTVQDALAVAISGDEVWVAAGTYAERITLPSGVSLYGGFMGVEASSDARSPRAYPTILDGGASGTVVTIPATVTVEALLDGFTIRNGFAGAVGGGGILCQGKAAIRNNIITANSTRIDCSADTGECTMFDGGGIYCDGGTVAITGNEIRNNRAYQGGGIAVVNGADATVQSNLIVANSAYGPSMRYTGAGGAIYVTNAACRILNNTVTQNKGIASSGLYVEAGADRVAVVNNILVNNTEPNTLMTEDLRTGTGATVHHNCFTPEQPIPVPDGNIAADPLFVDAASGNYHLKPDSPCRDAGEDTVVQVGDADLDGSPRRQGPHVDIGAYETPVDLSAVIHQLKVAAGLEVALQATAPVTMLDAVASLRQALGGL